MGSTISDAQVELIREHITSISLVIVMLDEDEAGSEGRDEVVKRLAKFCFVKAHIFDKQGMQPEHLSEDEVAALIA